MMELSKSSPSSRLLSWPERLELIKALNGMPLSQLLEVEIALAIPPGVMPAPSQASGMRNKALLEWVEGPTGVGLAEFLEVLREATGFSLTEESVRLEVVIDLSLDKADAGLLLEMLEELKKKANAPTIKISSISPGSIKLRLQGAPEELNRLKQLIESGALAEVAGQQVISVRIFPALRKANLSEADLHEADLHEADLHEADLRKANLSGANLHKANLYGAELSFANLGSANLSSTNLSSTNLSFTELNFANLSSAYLFSATLGSATLVSADLSGTNLVSANLRFATLRSANLRFATLRSANLASANLVSANLASADLSSADLSSANLYRADLSGANLNAANLSGATLVSANLSKVRLGEVVDVTGAIFGDNTGLSEEDKAELVRRGAVFEDAPGSDVPVGV